MGGKEREAGGRKKRMKERKYLERPFEIHTSKISLHSKLQDLTYSENESFFFSKTLYFSQIKRNRFSFSFQYQVTSFVHSKQIASKYSHFRISP